MTLKAANRLVSPLRQLHRRVRPAMASEDSHHSHAHPFEAALAMRPAKDPPPHAAGHSATRFTGAFATDWVNLAGTAHGGILLSQGLRAAERHIGRTIDLPGAARPSVVSVMGTYTSPILPALGEVFYDVVTSKTSKRFAWVESKIGQVNKGHMRHGISLTCCFALPNPPLADDDPLNPGFLPALTQRKLQVPSRSVIPDPAECPDQTETMKLAGFVKSPGFHLHREMRVSPKLAERVRAIAEGKDPAPPEERIDVSTLAWCRFSSPRPQDALSAAFFSDALIPLNLSLSLSTEGSKSYRPDVFYSWSTVGLSANFFGAPLQQPENGEGWLLMSADLQHTSQGRAELEFVIWDVDLNATGERQGRVVAVCRQSGVVVTRKRDVAA